MKILVANAGSTSVKFKLYNMDDNSVIAEGNCQRVGLKDSEIKYVDGNGKKFLFVKDLPSHSGAFKEIISLLTSGETKVINNVDEINAVGHRVSMGGAKFVKTSLIDDAFLAEVESFSEITPLHTPPQVNAIRACREVFGEDITMAAGFDTAYHQTIPPVSYVYPIPYEYLEKYNVRRFGFHGLSYQFVVQRYAELTGNDYSNHNMVVCHLGGGSSATAVKNGKSYDNTFGFGTGEGLVCGSRAGNFDHVGVGYLMHKTGKTYEEIESVLHRDSGLLGISGVSSDEREVEEAAAAGNERAKLALEIMAQQVKRYIGAYTFEMGGLDTIVFTGGIGENSDKMREMICAGLENLGVEMDKNLNIELNRSEGKISKQGSKVEIWIIPTNEELVIAQDTLKLINGVL